MNLAYSSGRNVTCAIMVNNQSTTSPSGQTAVCGVFSPPVQKISALSEYPAYHDKISILQYSIAPTTDTVASIGIVTTPVDVTYIHKHGA